LAGRGDLFAQREGPADVDRAERGDDAIRCRTRDEFHSRLNECLHIAAGRGDVACERHGGDEDGAEGGM
jgi:hypothetical protein